MAGRTIATVTLLVLLGVYLVCVPFSSLGQGETVPLDGLVINLATGEPLADVRVEAMLADARTNQQRHNGETGGDGRFRLASLPPGRYRLSASRPLFYAPPRQPVIVTLSAGNTATARLGLWPTAAITGRVLDENRAPLDRVSVAAIREQYRSTGTVELVVAKTVTTNDKGEYRLWGLPAGTYYLRAAKPGRALEFYYPGMLDRDVAASVRVAAGIELSAIDMSLPVPKTHSVRIKLDGLPTDERFSFEFVVMRKGARNAIPMRTETESLGDRAFRISALPPGTYEIAVRLQSVNVVAKRQEYLGTLGSLEEENL